MNMSSNPLISEGTRKKITIDLVFTNEEGMIPTLRHCSPLGKSHHVTYVHI